MAPVNLPPGFRFRPTDVEIVRYYLKTKVRGIKLELQVIGEIDLYKCEPWDLPEKSLLHSRDPEWYFFCPRDRKYPNGLRTNRATEAGYWKATGKDRKVSFQSSTIGMKKTLVFYKGRAPHGERTDWIMHEYRLQEKEREGATGLQDTYVLCRVFKKSGLGPKDGGQYDSPIEESCFSISKNKSPTRITSPGEIEDQSEETCLPVMQEEDTRASSGLPSETSSEILSSMTNNNNCLNGSMEPLQDAASPPNCDFTSQQEPGSNKNAESMPSPRLQCRNICPPWDIKDFPEIPDDLNFTETGYLFGEKMDASVEEAEILHIAHESQDPSYFIDNFGDILDGKILELDDFLPSIEELENLEPCLVEVADKLPDREGCQIQIRSRTPTWQSHQQTLASQGTAARRVRLQMHKTADANGQYGCTGHPQAATHDWHDHNSGELQVISHLKDSSLAALPRQMSALLEACPPKASRALDCGCTRDVGSIVLAESNNPKFGPISISNAESMDVNSWNNSLDYCMPDGAKRSPTTEFQCIGENEDSDFFPDSVEISERGGIGDGSTSMPQHSTSEYLLQGEPLEIIGMSGNGKSPSKYESTILKKWQSLISSGCGQPSCVLAASLTAVILQDGGEIPKQLFHKSADNCISDSLTNECTLLGESELTQKCEITTSKKDSIENQAVESDEKLVYGETLVFAETSTMKQSLENTAAPTNLPEMVLAKEDFECSGATSSFLSSIPIHSGLAMEHPTAWISKKGVLDSEVGTSPGLIQDLSISAYSTTLPETCMHCKRSVERSDFNRTSSGLTRRVKYNGLGGEGKSMDVAEDISECCSKQCINGSVSLEKASDIFMGLFQLQRRSSKGSNVSSMLVYLLGTAFLMLCFFLLRIIWHFAGTASPLIS